MSEHLLSLSEQSKPLLPGRLSADARDFLAGATAGVFGILCGQPFDTLRVRQQQAGGAAMDRPASCPQGLKERPQPFRHTHLAQRGSSAPPAQPRSMVSEFSRLVRKEGVAALYRGVTYPLAASALQSAVMFQAYGSALRWLTARTDSGGATASSNPAGSSSSGGSSCSNIGTSSSSSSVSSSNGCSGHHDGKPDQAGRDGGGSSSSSSAGPAPAAPPPPPLWHVALAGGYSGLMQASFMTTVDLLKIRMQVQQAARSSPDYRGPLRMLRHVVRQDGVRGLFRGLSITAIRDVPTFAAYFAVYAVASQALDPQASLEGRPTSVATQLAAGGLAGMSSWAVVYPLDVVKTRFQASGRRQVAQQARQPAAGGTYRTWLGCAASIQRQCGPRAFFAGLNATLTRAALVNAVTLCGYEAITGMLTDGGLA